MTEQAQMPIVLLEFKSVTKGSLRGFAKVRVGRGLVINDVAIMVSNGRARASLPAKPMLDRAGIAIRDGEKIRYVPVLEWADKAAADRFSRAVVEKTRAEYPDALEPVA